MTDNEKPETVTLKDMIMHAEPVVLALVDAIKKHSEGPLEGVLALELAKNGLIRECQHCMPPELRESFDDNVKRLLEDLGNLTKQFDAFAAEEGTPNLIIIPGRGLQ